jgi:excisionase family DNA binding protein
MTGRDRAQAEAAQPSLLTVSEAARLLRISRNLCYELIAQDRLPHIRLGRRILVHRYGLEQWIARESGSSPPPHGVLPFRTPTH